MSSPPFPEWLDSASQPPLVGRRSEREQMNSCWEEVTEGRRQIVLIGGEPGIGKSRLVCELAMSADEAGATVGDGEKLHKLGSAPAPPGFGENILAVHSNRESPK